MYQAVRKLLVVNISAVEELNAGFLCRPELINTILELGSLVAMRMIGSQNQRSHVVVFYH